ncbi:MAG: sirohydrochlorin cobaltochelatase [Victivallales bacterium]|nr:sirohydrochlorin cobaltochelatase [Victivallales bacterium]
MKSIVIYSSRKSGNSKKLAQAIAAGLGDGCELYSAADAPLTDKYDFVIFGFGIYRGWPDGDMRACMKRCRNKNVGLFMTLGAWPDSDAAISCMARAEGLLDTCKVKARFTCHGALDLDFIERLKQLPASSSHAWNDERAARIEEAAKHPDEKDMERAVEIFCQAAEKLRSAPSEKTTPEKRATVMAVFGTTIPEAAKAYDFIEEHLRQISPGVPVFRAYTSGKVRKKLAYAVPSLIGVLKQLHIEGFNKINIAAIYLSPGEEYHKLLRDVSAFKREMDISVSHPPLSSGTSLKHFIEAVNVSLPKDVAHGDAVLFMGHGNADGRADFQYAAAAEELAKLNPNFHLACVEGKPEFEQVMTKIKSNRVWLIPFMIVAGDHALNDMSGDESDSWKKQLESAGHECHCVLHGLGESPSVAAYFAKNMELGS